MKTSSMQWTFDFTEDGIEFGIIESHPLNDHAGVYTDFELMKAAIFREIESKSESLEKLKFEVQNLKPTDSGKGSIRFCWEKLSPAKKEDLN